MRRYVACIIVILLAGATAPLALAQEGPPPPPPPSEPPAVAKAKALLAQMVQAYQAAPVYADRVIVRYSYGGSESPPLESAILLGPGTDARIDTGGNVLTAVDGRMTVTYPQHKDRYIEVPLDGDLVRTVKKVFGRYGGPMAPAALRYGKPIDELVDVLAYGLPDRARISGYREITDANNKLRRQISLISASGSVAVNVDPETLFVDTIALEYVDAQAPVPNLRVTLDMQFQPDVLSALPAPIAFDPAGRMAFSTIGALSGSAAPESLRHVKVAPGEPAPDFSLHTLEGVEVSLSGLRGSVVVLCFWMWLDRDAQDAMHVMQELADWATASAVPLEVWPIHALGSGRAGEPWEGALRYWENHPFTIMSLIDEDGAVPAAYGITGVPMVVLIDREGKVVKVAAGLADINVEQLKTDVLKTLGLPSTGS